MPIRNINMLNNGSGESATGIDNSIKSIPTTKNVIDLTSSPIKKL